MFRRVQSVLSRSGLLAGLFLCLLLCGHADGQEIAVRCRIVLDETCEQVGGFVLVDPASKLEQELVAVVRAAPGSSVLAAQWNTTAFATVEEAEGQPGLFFVRGQGTFLVTVIEFESGKASQSFVELGDTPDPEPEPEPDPPPDPDDGDDDDDEPGPAPIEGDGLRVLLIHESAELMPREYEASFYGPEVTRFLKEHCVKVDGHPEFRRLDPDTKFTDPNHRFAKALERPRTADPWLIVSNGKTGYEGPLPKSPSETIELIKRYQSVSRSKKTPKASVTMVTTDSCPPCKAFLRVEAPKLAGKLEVVKNRLPGVKVRLYPTFVIRANGKERILQGYQTAERLTEEIAKLGVDQ